VTLLETGTYYFTFVASEGGVYETGTKRVEILSEDYLDIETNKDDYWKGEKIEIRGRTNANKVKGSVYYVPEDEKVTDFEVTVKADKTFSYNFTAGSDWEEGNHEIRTTVPLAKTIEFSVWEFFEVTPLEWVSETVTEGEDFSYDIDVRNLKENATNVSVSVSGDLKAGDLLPITKETLGPNEVATITIRINDIDSDVDGPITLETDDGLRLDIPVSITVQDEDGTAVTVTGVKLFEVDKDTVAWSAECVAGETVEEDIQIKNNADSIISGFSYEVYDVNEGGLEALDEYEAIIAGMNSFSVGPGATQDLKFSVTPTISGEYQGLVIISSGGDSAYVYVDLKCFDDITEDIETLRTDLESLGASDETYAEINSLLDSAGDSLEWDRYQLAKDFYQQAKAKYDVVKAGGGAGQPMDFTLIIVIIVIVVVIVVLLYFFKFKKPGSSEEYDEGVENLEGF